MDIILAVSRVDQSKLKSTSISYTKDFDNGVDTTEVDRKFCRLEHGTIIVNSRFACVTCCKR